MKNRIRLWAHVKRIRFVRQFKKWDTRVERQVRRPYELFRDNRLQRKSARLEQEWVDSRFIFGQPNTKQVHTPNSMAEQFAPSHGVTIPVLQQQINEAVGKMKGIPAWSRQKAATKTDTTQDK